MEAMKIVENNYKEPRHFPIGVECPSCKSRIRIEGPADLDAWAGPTFFVRCPACKQRDIIVEISPRTKDMVLEHIRRRGPGAMDQR